MALLRENRTIPRSSDIEESFKKNPFKNQHVENCTVTGAGILPRRICQMISIILAR
jgi:hypothetical protein